MDKILEMLGITKLDEEKQAELKAMLEAIIASKANELLEPLAKEQKEKLVEEMEVKFESYKDDITSKFSNFLDDILEEELVLPANVVEYARLGEEYKPLIESFKTKLAIDANVLDEEVKSILKEAKDEIVKLQSEKDEVTATKLTLEVKNNKLVNENYLLSKCDGLSPNQRKNIMTILEGATIAEIDNKFAVLVKLNEEEEAFKTKVCPECGIDVKEDVMVCPECGYKWTEDKKNESITDTKTKDVKESLDPRTAWLKMINERKI